MKRPAFQFYPGDWLRSTDLRSCSVGARGLWIDMICLMHEGAPYGYLRVGSKDILPPILANMVGASLAEVEEWLKELENSAVFSRKPVGNGCIYSRRMVNDEKIRESRAKGGIKSLDNPNVPRPKISLGPSLDPSPASAVASSSAGSSSSSISKKSNKGNGKTKLFDLPDWIPREQWNAWIDARKSRRNAPNEFAKRLAVAKLANLHEQGYSPAAVLAQSAFNGWAGLFPIKEPKR